MLAGQNGARGRVRTCTGDVLDVVPLRWATRANGMEPPAGAAQARFLYKRNPQAAARRRKWPAGRSSKSEGWSQSPVLPLTQRAYETCLSAGSTAVVLTYGHYATKLQSPTRNCTELASIPKKCIAQNALGAMKLASLTGFAPVISCMRGRHVVWTTPQGRK